MNNFKEFFEILNSVLSNPIIMILFGFSLISTSISTLYRAIKPVYKEHDEPFISNDKEEKVVYKKVIVTPKIKKELPNVCVNCGAQLNGNDVCEYCGTKY